MTDIRYLKELVNEVQKSLIIALRNNASNPDPEVVKAYRAICKIVIALR